MPARGVSNLAFNLAEDVPLSEVEGAAEWATAEPEEDDYMQYFDWDRYELYDAEGDEAEAAEQGGAAGGEQGGEA